MKKKECPSCAMEIEASAEFCPICRYEFSKTSAGLKWAAILLAVLLLLLAIIGFS